jgi:hypothetical protein
VKFLRRPSTSLNVFYSSKSVLAGAGLLNSLGGAHLALAGIWPRKPGGRVPVQMIDGVRVLCGLDLSPIVGEQFCLPHVQIQFSISEPTIPLEDKQ